jgi:hypothetical protein
MIRLRIKTKNASIFIVQYYRYNRLQWASMISQKKKDNK